MRSEVTQGDEITIRVVSLVLQMDIQVLKLNSTTMTIMTHTHPGFHTKVNKEGQMEN